MITWNIDGFGCVARADTGSATIHVHISVYTRINRHTYALHTYMHACMHARMHACMLACIYRHTQTYVIYTHIYIYTHTVYICTHTHIWGYMGR